MAYRRRQGITKTSTFKEEIYTPPDLGTSSSASSPSPLSSSSSSLAAQAIRASAAHRDSSLSSAYGDYAFHSSLNDNGSKIVMISGYVSAGCYFEALGIFADMKQAGVETDAITFTSVLAACSQLAALEQGKEIHKCITESKLASNEIVVGALLDMYAKCPEVEMIYECLSLLTIHMEKDELLSSQK